MTPATLTTSTPTGRPLDLEAHGHAWTGPNAKARAAEAARDRDPAALWSLVAAMLDAGDRVSVHTARAYRAGVLAYIAWAEAEGVNILRPDRRDGERYRRHLVRVHTRANPDPAGEPIAANVGTVNTRLSGARSLYRGLAWTGLEHADPFATVRSLKDKRDPSTIRDAYSHADLARLLGAADDPHDRAAVLLGAHAGLRAAEMLTLDWAAVTLPERDASGTWATAGEMIVHGKGGTVRPVPVGDALADALDALPERTGPVLAHVRSGSGLRYRVARLAERAGLIDRARPKRGETRTKDGKPAPRSVATLGLHRLRHRFGTDVVAARGLAVGQTALRHASPTTTARYAHEREAEVAAFVRTLGRS